VFRLLGPMVLRRRAAVLALLVWSVPETLPALVSGGLLEVAVDRGFRVGLVGAGVAWLGLYALVVVCGGWAIRRTTEWLGRIVEPLREDLTTLAVDDILHRTDVWHLRPDASGLARLNVHIETVRDLVAALLMGVRQCVCTAVAVAAGLGLLVPALTLPILGTLAGAVALFLAATPVLVHHQQAQLRVDEQLATTVGTAVHGRRDVIACGATRTETHRIDSAVEADAIATRRLTRLIAVRNTVLVTGGYLPLLLVLAMAPAMIREGRFSIGALLGTISYLTTALQPAIHTVAHTLGSSGLRLSVHIRHMTSRTAASPPRPGVLTPRCPTLRLRSVGFRYGPGAEPILSGSNLTVRYGEHLAVVGPSGGGKSTLASLMAGLLLPDTGQILLDDTPISTIGTADLRRRVALLPQQAYVFAGTLRENLTQLNPVADDEAVHASVDALGATELVAELGGLDALVGAGHRTLSGGQQQLVALIRTYLSPADVVILDEASSCLDAETEAHVERAFRRRGGTLVIITHRMAAANRADRILTMDEAAPRAQRPSAACPAATNPVAAANSFPGPWS
jgi:ATP-binding cassette, subfamily C, bacterial